MLIGRRLYIISDPSPIKLFHPGRKEVEGLISLLEVKWDRLMLWDPALYNLEGDLPDNTTDPMQEHNMRSKVPKSNLPHKLKQVQNQESESFLMESVYELKAAQNYLKVNFANSDTPWTMFPVSGR